MMLLCEGRRAGKQTRRFLVKLLQTKGISREIKDRARSLLKHYPMDIDMRIVGDNSVFVIFDEEFFND